MIILCNKDRSVGWSQGASGCSASLHFVYVLVLVLLCDSKLVSGQAWVFTPATIQRRA